MPISKVIDSIIKSESDDRQYRGLVLTNGLKVLLISDPKTDMSSAALEVNVGSMSEPKAIPGLAHFLEHMLFLGSKKFPDEIDYRQFISGNGGHNNAYTNLEQTNFFFDVSTDNLSEALDMFAQFFIDPLMTESATEREMKAVDAEFQKNRDLDGRRIYHLQRMLTNPDHDYNRFSTGNIESLRDNPLKEGIDVRKALFEFHDNWYSANIMSLVVLGKETIDDLSQMVVPLFESIKNLNVTPKEWPQHPMSNKYIGKRIRIVPITDFRELVIVFPLHDLKKEYKSKEEKVKEWIIEEIKNIMELNFKYKEKSRPLFYTEDLASRMKHYPMEEILTGPELIEEFRPDLISQVLECLTPKNMNVVIIGKKFEGSTDCEEKWYGVKYKMTDIDQNLMVKWMNCGLNEKFSLPPKNDFIPRDLSLKPKENSMREFPTIIKNTKMNRIWFLQDNKYNRPLASYAFKLHIPCLVSEPINKASSTIFIRLVRDSLKEFLYAPDLARLHFDIWLSEDSLKMDFYGYNDKLNDFMDVILDKVTKFEIDPKRFDVIKEECYRGYKTHHTSNLLYLVHYYSDWILSQRYWSVEELLETEEEVTVESVSLFVSKLFERFHIEGLIHGNITRDEAMKVIDTFEAHFPKSKAISQAQQWRNREIQLTDGSNLLFDVTNSVHQTNGIRVYFQIGVDDNGRHICLISLFLQIIKEKFFDELRTKQQLGYIVSSGCKTYLGVLGLTFEIQSEYSPRYLDERIEAFLVYIKEYLMVIKDETFKKEKEALITQIMESPKKLFTYNSRLWREIDNKIYHFDRDQSEVNIIKDLTKNDIIQFYEKYVSHESSIRKKLSVHLTGTKPSKVIDEEESKKLLKSPQMKAKRVLNVTQLHETSALYGLPKPVIDIYNFNDN